MVEYGPYYFQGRPGMTEESQRRSLGIPSEEITSKYEAPRRYTMGLRETGLPTGMPAVSRGQRALTETRGVAETGGETQTPHPGMELRPPETLAESEQMAGHLRGLGKTAVQSLVFGPLGPIVSAGRMIFTALLRDLGILPTPRPNEWPYTTTMRARDLPYARGYPGVYPNLPIQIGESRMQYNPYTGQYEPTERGLPALTGIYGEPTQYGEERVQYNPYTGEYESTTDRDREAIKDFLESTAVGMEEEEEEEEEEDNEPSDYDFGDWGGGEVR